jgi:hypothetical protein
MVKSKSLEEKDDDGWARFEHAVDAALKSGPKHKTVKREMAREGDSSKPDLSAIRTEKKL